MQLLEGDRKAYYESAEYTMKQNREKIARMRQENNELRKQKADKLKADEQVVSKGLEDNPEERTALRNKPGPVAIMIMDEKIGDRVNVLNTTRYRTRQKQARLNDLQMQYKTLGGTDEDSGSGGGNSTSGGRGGSGGGKGRSSTAGSSRSGNRSDAECDGEGNKSAKEDEGQRERDLENRLDKSNLKCREAEHIQRTYLQIKVKLEDEQKSFENILDGMEQDIVRMKHQLKELKVLHNDAQIARDRAKEDLIQLEKQLYKERKAREIEMQNVRKEADEKRQQQELFQRRIAARSSMAQDEMTSEQRLAVGLGDEDQEKIHTYEEAFRRIKEATGVSDTQEVVLRFENQGDTQHHLEELKTENEREIARLTEERDRLRNEYIDMKYSGEAKLSSGQRLLEEYEEHVAEEEQRKNDAQAKLEKASKILVDVKSGVEHLTEKLKVLKSAPSEVQKTKVPPTSDEYVLDQLCICEEKLLKLLEDLESSGKDVNKLTQQMEAEEFPTTLDIRLPAHNTRVKLPAVAKDTMYDDEDASGEDEDVMTRHSLKKQSQQIIDAKTRRGRPGKRKKKASGGAGGK
jgi:hypothetical protein